MKKQKPTASSFQSATPVSYRLQFTTVAVALSAVAVQLWYFVPMFTNSSWNPNASYFWQAALQSLLFPLAVFVVAFLTTRRYTAPIGRWFVATVKSFIVIAISGILTSLWASITSTYYASGSGVSSSTMPPAWVTSNAPIYIIMVLCLAAMLRYAYRSKK